VRVEKSSDERPSRHLEAQYDADHLVDESEDRAAWTSRACPAPGVRLAGGRFVYADGAGGAGPTVAFSLARKGFLPWVGSVESRAIG